jgi:enoyl-[acyl-carrier-protein] reductase (NADH)
MAYVAPKEIAPTKSKNASAVHASNSLLALETEDERGTGSTKKNYTSCLDTSSYSFCALARRQNGSRERIDALFQ